MLARDARVPDPRDLPRRPGAERRAAARFVQDIPSQVPGALVHKLEVPPHQAFELAHEIWIDKDTRMLARLMRERLSDADSCDVEQPSPPGRPAARARLHRVGHRAGRRHRSD